MVSTRQSSNVGNAGEASGNDNTGIKTRHSAHQSHSQHILPSFSTSSVTGYVSTKHFLDLPPEIFEKIFSYTGYKTVSQMRLVSSLNRIMFILYQSSVFYLAFCYSLISLCILQ